MDVLLALEANNSTILFHCARLFSQTIRTAFFPWLVYGNVRPLLKLLFSGHSKWFQMKIKNVQ